MPRRTAEEDEWDEDEDGWDDDASDEEQEPTISCPYCHRQIHEDSERCPHCEAYISSEDAPASRKPWWIIIGVLICLYAIYRWIAG